MAAKAAIAKTDDGWRDSDLRKFARQILTDNVITAPPVLVQQIAQNYKFRVGAPKFPSELASSTLGFVALKARNILVNGSEPAESQNAAIGRLFARAWLIEKGEVRPPEDVISLERGPLAATSSPEERSADVLAAYLLMPPALLEKYGFAPLSSLARLFIVPEEFVRWRLTLG